MVLALLALDLGVLQRKAHVISAKEALGWTAFWIALAFAFNGLLYVMYEHHWFGIGQTTGHPLGGRQAALQFLTAYLVEKSLSLDNIFVIAMIFGYLKVPELYQHRVLFWGILGALIMRGTMIGAGLALMNSLSWMIYVFGALLLITAFKMLLSREEEVELEKNLFVRMMRKLFPVTDGYREQHFFVREAGRRAITPLGLAVVLVESTDIMFAVDSIPAVFAVTQDPFIVFTSNVFAILGLRSLYFALAAVMHKFTYLKASLVFLLVFIGLKMLASRHYHVPAGTSLVMIGGILLIGVLTSLLVPRPESKRAEVALSPELGALFATAYRQVQRVFVFVAGTTLVLVGIALLVLPGPGLLTIAGGLALLGTQFVWARRWLDRLTSGSRQLAGKAGRALAARRPRAELASTAEAEPLTDESQPGSS
jgi:tellurite resistance protein TerC